MSKIQLQCTECGAPIERDPCHVRERNYCGRRCMARHQRREGTLIPHSYDHLIGNKHGVGHHPPNEFRKGHVPWTAGTKGLRQSPATEFKPGHKHALEVPAGTIKQRRPGRKPRNYIKLADKQEWMALSRYMWEKAYGPIPDGHFIHHMNEDMLDDRLENLECLSPSDHTQLHARLRRETAGRL